jgi:integrase
MSAGDYPFAQMEPKDVAKLRDLKVTNDKGQPTPQTANGIVKALRAVFGWATLPEYAFARSNPAALVPYLESSNPDGLRPWTEFVAREYEARHLLGTKPHLALALFLYIAARLSDVARLGPGMERDGVLHWTEYKGRSKTAKHHETPILPPLREAIDAYYAAGNPRHMVYLATEQGKQYSDKGLGNWFSRQCRLAGLDPGYSAHGLRKFGAVRAVEHGATEAQLMAIFGWETSKQALLYTKSRNRRRLEATGINTLLRHGDREQSVDKRVALLPTVRAGATIRRKKL